MLQIRNIELTGDFKENCAGVLEVIGKEAEPYFPFSF